MISKRIMAIADGILIEMNKHDFCKHHEGELLSESRDCWSALLIQPYIRHSNVLFKFFKQL